MSKPNILFFLTDQHSPRVAGCYGDKYVRTPTLDRLAREGVTFDACYCDNPLCVPSRMSLLTARHGHELGIWGNEDSLDSTVPTLAHGFGIAGYRTVLVGRMHFVGGDQHHGFHERAVGDVTSQYTAMNRSEHRFRGFYGCRESLENAGAGNSFDLAYDTTVAMEARRVVRDHEVSGDPRPLFLMVSFYSPHDPYVMPAKDLAPYLDVDDEPVDAAPEAPHPFTKAQIEGGDYASVTADQRRRARAAYRAKTAFADGLMEQVITDWQDSPLSEDTITVYTSDHGDMQGEHGIWAKGSFYDASARVPLIIHAPERLPAGIRLSDPLGLVDLGATLLEAADAPPLPNASGRSFWSACRGQSNDWPGRVFSEQAALNRGGPCRMIRQGPWKYCWYAEHEPELYNLEDDPGEMSNRAEDPDCAEICTELKTRLFADGWDPEQIRNAVQARQPDRAYLYKFARALEPADPYQWGLPAQL